MVFPLTRHLCVHGLIIDVLLVMLITILGTLLLPYIASFFFPDDWQALLDMVGIVLH